MVRFTAHKKLSGRRTVICITILIVIAGGSLWLFRSKPVKLAAAEQQAVMQQVAQLAVVPSGETPSITTVINKAEVKQAFLQNAENGDKVLLYFQAGRAIVYRPSTHKIVNMGPLDQPIPSVFIRNGTTTELPANLTAKVTDGQQFNLLSRDQAVKHDYKTTLVVDLAGNRPDIATKLARQLGATVAPLPAGESRPDADLLVIVGSDAK